MSDSEKKTPTVSPDPGATGETATSDGDGKGSVQDAQVICWSVSRSKGVTMQALLSLIMCGIIFMR